MKRTLAIALLFLLPAVAAQGGIGSAESAVFSLVIPAPQPEGVAYPYGERPAAVITIVTPVPDTSLPAYPFGEYSSAGFTISTDRVAFGYSDLFSLHLTGEVVTTDWYHLGDDPVPPCTDPVSQNAGSQVVVTFPLTGDELADHRRYGTDLVFQCRAVQADAVTAVVLNGTTLAPLPVASGCTSATYDFPVTDLLLSGVNTLTVTLASGSDCLVGDFRLAMGVGDPGAVTLQVQPSLGTVVFAVDRGGQPFDGVRIDVLLAGQVIRTGQPSGGTLTVGGLIDGEYGYRLRDGGDQGAILETGTFTIDLSNQVPQVTSTAADPALVPNDGTGGTTLRVVASDPDGSVAAVTVDLRQVGGAAAQPLAPVAGDTFAVAITVPAGTAPASYVLPVQVVDDRGAYGHGLVSLAVTPAAGWDATTVHACGFTVQATSIGEGGDGTWIAAGDVKLTHDSGLPLYLVGNGTLTVRTAAPQTIQASGDWTLKADLGDLGVYDLYHGAFGIDEQGNLTVGDAANYLLDEIAGFPRGQDGGVDLDLVLAGTPGIRVTADLVFDQADGVPGNGAPAARIQATLLTDGSVLGVLAADGGGSLQWDLSAGTASVDSLLLVNRQVTVVNAGFTFLPGTFDFDSKTTLTIPRIVIGPDGIQADGFTLDDFDFRYGGFTFHVDEAALTDDAFTVRRARAVFPLPGGDAEVGVEDIAIAGGTVTLQGGELRIPPLKIGSYDLAGVYGHFSRDADHLFIAAEGQLAIPAFATVDISFSLDSNCPYLLQEFCMAADLAGRGVPIGNTGFLLTDIGGCLADPSCGNTWIITFTAGIASADYVDPPGVSLLSADTEMHIVPRPFQIGASGTVYLVGNELGGAGFDLYPDRFEGYGNLMLPPGLPVLVAQSDLLLRWSPDFYFQGTAEGVLQIPVGELPALVRGLIPGDNIQVGYFTAGIDPEQIQGTVGILEPEDPIAELSASYAWASGDFSYSVDVDWGWPWLHLEADTGRGYGIVRRQRYLAVAAKGLRRAPLVRSAAQLPLLLPAEKAPLAAVDTVTTVVVPDGAPPLVVLLNEQPAGAGTYLTLTLLTPAQTVVDSSYCAAHAGYTYYRGPDAACYLVDAPDAGNWTVVVGDIQPEETYQLDAFFRNQPPAFQWLAPDAAVDAPTSGQVDLAWQCSDPDGDDVLTTLLAIPAAPGGTDAAGDPGPWLLAADLPDSVTTFAWLPAALRDGSYRVVAECRDRFGLTVRDTCPAVITLTNLDHPRAPAGLHATVGPGRIRVMWDPQGRDDLRGFRLFYRPQGAATVDTLDVGLTGQFLLRSLQDGVPYEVWLEGYDVMGQAGPASAVLTATPHELGDVEPPPVPAALTVAGYDPDANVVTVTWEPAGDAVAYRLYYDTDPAGLYTGTGAAEGDSPVLQGRATTLTLTGLPVGHRYFLAVSAVDAAGNESAPSDPVPVLVSGFEDVDKDRLPDDWEQAHLGGLDSGPADDPDGDFLSNIVELEQTLTDPGRPDTDGDAVVDGVDPHPLSARDADQDGLPDDWQAYHQAKDPEADPDQDLLANRREFAFGGLPHDPDTDGDGLSDGFEADSTGTAVDDADSDGGGVPDGEELAAGSDPLDPTDDAGTTAVPGEDVPRVTRLLPPRPNPFNARVTVAFDLARAGRAEVAVYDVRGRRVRTLVATTLTAARHEIAWDGRDDGGRILGSGTYFVRLRADHVQQIRKVMLVK